MNVTIIGPLGDGHESGCGASGPSGQQEPCTCSQYAEDVAGQQKGGNAWEAEEPDMVNQEPAPALIAESVVPFPARKAMQEAIFEMFKTENEWTTWSDSVALAEAAAHALEDGGFVVTQEFKRCGCRVGTTDRDCPDCNDGEVVR